MAKDRFSDRVDNLIAFGKKHTLVVPSDTQDLATIPKVIYVETGGTIAVKDSEGTLLSYKTYDGGWLPIRPTRIMATGTTGTYYAHD